MRAFGAAGDGVTADEAAINKAVQAASAIVSFPPGTYRLTSAIHLDRDGISLVGGPGVVLLVDPPAPGALSAYPEGVLVNKDNGKTVTHRVSIQDLTFLVRGGPADSSHTCGVLQLNNCEDCAVRHVHIMRDSSIAQLPAGLDGIVMAVGSRGGLIEGCTIDGIPKAGIYVPPNIATLPNTQYTRIDNCEVRNVNGAVGAVGLTINADNVIVSNTQAHDNRGAGLVIETIGLNPPVPPRNIQIIGGHYDGNGRGIVVASAYPALPEHLQFVGVSVLHNQQTGIALEQATDVLIAGASVGLNGGAGIVVGSPPQSPSAIQISNVSVFNNGARAGHAGLAILSNVDSVTVSGGHFYDDQEKPTQSYGIELLPAPSGSQPSHVRLLDVDSRGTGGLLQNSFAVTAPPNAQAKSGYYRVQYEGSPTSHPFAAPPGSEYVDTSHGDLWIKSQGTGPDGWSRLPGSLASSR